MVVFDVETNGVARKLRGHTRQIQSLRFVRSREVSDNRRVINVDDDAVGLEMVDTFSARIRTGNAYCGI